MTTEQTVNEQSRGADGSVQHEYRIEKVQDFLKVPPGRINACLEEFRDWINLALEMREMIAITSELVGAENVFEAPEFVWIDDGKRNHTVILETHVEAPNAEAEKHECRVAGMSVYFERLVMCLTNIAANSFWKAEAIAWKALYMQQRGGQAWSDMQKELAETRSKLRAAMAHNTKLRGDCPGKDE